MLFVILAPLGVIVLSITNVTIHSQWILLVATKKAEHWSQKDTLWMTAITGFAHAIGTILIGGAVSTLTYRLAYGYEELIIHFIAPGAFCGLGLLNSYRLRNQRFSRNKHHYIRLMRSNPNWNRLTTIATLSAVMFFSPCFEMVAFYLLGSALGYWGLALISTVYLVVTLSGMLAIVRLGLKENERFVFKVEALKSRSSDLAGIVLVTLSILTFTLDS